MELLDRYLQAVKFWLPKEQKQDIIAELSEDIQSQIDDNQSVLGRELTQAELGAILKQLGRPVLVANRYLPQQYLIGPVLFPIYKYVLKVAALIYLVPWVMTWIGLMIFDEGYRGRYFGGNWMATLGSFWSSFWSIAFLSVGIITLVFVALERVNAKSGFLEDWDPNKLPPVRDPNQIPRSASIIEIVMNFVFCSWWLREMWSPIVFDQPGVRLTLSPLWRYFFWGFLLLSLANMAASAVNLARPYWTRWRAGTRLVLDGIGSALFFWLCRSNIVVALSIQNVAPEKTLHFLNVVNMWISRGAFWVVAVGVVIAAFDVYRIIRVQPTNRQITRIVAASGLPSSVQG
jgi:hypothetical protein